MKCGILQELIEHKIYTTDECDGHWYGLLYVNKYQVYYELCTITSEPFSMNKYQVYYELYMIPSYHLCIVNGY